MSKRQDRQGVRTPADVERKYDLGKNLKSILNILARHESNQKELNAELEKMTSEFWQTTGEMEKVAEEMKDSFDVTKKDIDNTANEMRESLKEIEALEADMDILANWTDGTRSGVAGFVARADEDATTLATLVKNTGEGDSTALAAFKIEVKDTYATIESLTAFENETTEALTGIRQEASDMGAEIDILTSFKNDTTETLAGIREDVNANKASIDLLVSFEDETNETLAGIKTEASKESARIDSLVSFQNGATDTMAGLRQDVNANKASIDAIATFKDDTNKALAGITAEATATNARIDTVASLQTETSNNLAAYKTEVGNTYATQTLLAALQTATDTAIAAINTKVTTEYATNEMVSAFNDRVASIEVKANANESAIKLKADKIDLEGYVTIDGFLEVAQAKIDDLNVLDAKIGGWTIGDVGIYHDSALNNCMGMLAVDYDTEHPLIWAGYEGTFDDLISDTSWQDRCAFSVSAFGRLHSSNGQLGCFLFDKSKMYSSAMELRADGIHFSCPSNTDFMWVRNETLELTYGIYLDPSSGAVKYRVSSVDGDGGSSGDDNTDTFTFTIGGTSYKAEFNMTWAEWCESSYNTDGYYIEGGVVLTEDYQQYVSGVNEDSVITSKAYTLENY